ncbi:TPA: ATP-binding protein [Vibrio parahaemolyticus]|nr:ATP-binding protein [Vibrio parahaemolyticus]MBM4844266.1 ATP-binding protein [Vibrio parahaemolyticus]HCG6120242.1 ATP-binding protein [Vibrio parahaemolyticus]HCG6123542.1 ATP-binding protein [Vibrio parahaemolyticus]
MIVNITPEQRAQLAAYENCFIEYPEITEIYSIFDQLRFNQSLGGEPESFLLTGEAGSGKTALIDNYLSRFEVSANSWSQQTILSTRIPSRVNEQNTLTQFLIDLDVKSGGRGVRRRNEIALAEAVVAQLKRKSVELIIVNEVQELIEFSTAQERQVIANTFKYISEEARVSFVLVGMPYASVLAQEPQWDSRLSWRRNLDYFKLFKSKINEKNTARSYEIDTLQKKHFAKFVAGLASRMGYDNPPKLTKNDTLYPLFVMCRGECRRLKHFLSDAMIMSFKESTDTIDKETLSRAFAFKFPHMANPFACSLSEIKLSQIDTNSMYNTTAIATEDRILAPRFTDDFPLSMLLSKSGVKI